jgi:hypothetical protein
VLLVPLTALLRLLSVTESIVLPPHPKRAVDIEKNLAR